MRAVLVVLGVLLVLGVLAPAEDGSVVWPVDGVGAQPLQLDVYICAAICAAGGCDFNGDPLDCTCSGGRVCCAYYRCVSNPRWWEFWRPCYCAVVIECYSIPCQPGQPIPMRAPGGSPVE